MAAVRRDAIDYEMRGTREIYNCMAAAGIYSLKYFFYRAGTTAAGITPEAPAHSHGLVGAGLAMDDRYTKYTDWLSKGPPVHSANKVRKHIISCMPHLQYHLV